METLLKARLSMISNFAAAAPALWTAVTITFAGAEIVRTGKNCLKRERGCAIMLLIIIRKSP